MQQRAPANAWSNTQLLPPVTTAAPALSPPAIAPPDETTWLVVYDNDGRVWGNYTNLGGTWQKWRLLGAGVTDTGFPGPPPFAPGLGLGSRGCEVYAVAAAADGKTPEIGRLWQTSSDGEWLWVPQLSGCPVPS